MSKVLTEPTEILLHQFAYGCYQNGLFEKSLRVFRLLAMFRSTDARYWYGLGSALLALNRESEAIHPLKMAAVCAPDDPRPRVYLAECLAKNSQEEEATKWLFEAKQLLDREENSALQERIRVIQEKVSLCQ
jgi:Flp pilus assembly protein TadD